MNRYKNLIAMFIFAIILASCSNSTSSSSTSLTVGNIKIPPATAPQPTLPFDAYVLPGSEPALVFYVGTLLVKSCMTKKGFPFPPESLAEYAEDPFYDQQPQISTINFGVDSMKEAKTYGYDDTPIGGKAITRQDDRMIQAGNHAVIRYIQEYGKAYSITLMGGTGPSTDSGCLKYQLATYLLPKHLASEYTKIQNIHEQYQNNSIVETQHNPIVLSDIKKWSSCMASHGYDVKTPPPANRNPKATPLTKAEITEATIDYGCKVKVNMMNTWLAVESYYQTQIINEHPTEFQKVMTIDSWLSNV